MVARLTQAPGKTLEWAANAWNRLVPLLVIVSMFAGVIIAVKAMRPKYDPTPVLVISAKADGADAQSLSLPDALFDFDRPELKEDGVKRVREIAAQLKAFGADQVVVIGHADRLGAVQRNADLSRGRAESVREELAKLLRSELIYAVGLGDHFPKTRPNECRGSSTDPAVIECLAKDRRVEIWARRALSSNGTQPPDNKSTLP